MGKFDGILIASDLDGTLLYNGEVSDENRAAINYFMGNGGLFTIATGRAPEFIEKLNIPVNAPIIAINGNLVYDSAKDEIIKNYTFSPHMLCVARDLVSKEKLISVTIHSMKAYPYPKPKSSDFDNFDKPINKVVFVFDDEDITLRVKEELIEKYSPDFIFERSWPTGLEMRSSQGGKGVCLSIIKELTGAVLTIAAGDFENDLTLLQAADIGYAPCSGHLSIMEEADRVTVACCDHVIAAIVDEIDKKGFDI